MDKAPALRPMILRLKTSDRTGRDHLPWKTILHARPLLPMPKRFHRVPPPDETAQRNGLLLGRRNPRFPCVRRPKCGGRHGEWLQDLLLHILVQRLSRNTMNQFAQHHIADITVYVSGSGSCHGFCPHCQPHPLFRRSGSPVQRQIGRQSARNESPTCSTRRITAVAVNNLVNEATSYRVFVVAGTACGKGVFRASRYRADQPYARNLTILPSRATSTTPPGITPIFTACCMIPSISVHSVLFIPVSSGCPMMNENRMGILP